MVLRRNKKTVKATKTMDSSDLSSKIQQKAYSLYEKRGNSHGNDWNDWFEAECQVKKELGLK
ncbi:MAG: DUF2934 domain-containing protein [Candidatus Omnitrophica bacterium]|nr:DUF2934 domain-containing protein [Candidatus Omnitrophota bacterium]